ncbi:phage tail fiber protein [Sporosarcina sp. FSL K6-5500]|uniref:phage tail fiber protein n=1 Tax=Sporosarcina sp. FSL K6-5500 TaxID=2921558 RepID=UPI0030F4B7A5
MTNMSTYLEKKLLAESLNGAFIALYTSDPTDGDTGAEVTDTSYARQPVTFSPPVSAMGETSVTNTNRIVFPVVQRNIGFVTHLGIRDALSGGNLLFHGMLYDLIDLKLGMAVEVKFGQIKVTLG